MFFFNFSIKTRF